jgi:hypothetical protein
VPPPDPAPAPTPTVDQIPAALRSDRYGGRFDPTAHVTEKERKLQAAESSQEKDAEVKWIAMLGPETTGEAETGRGRADMDFRLFRTVNEELFQRRVMKGIPDSCRSRAWRLIIDPKSADGEPRKQLSSHFKKGVPPTDDAIKMDITGTLPHVAVSSRTRAVLAEPLYRVLRAYANSDKVLGYVQGMGVYAALFLGYMDENQAYWCFYHLLRGAQHMLADFFVNDFMNLRSLNVVWEKILQIKLPKVYDNLRRLKVEAMTYTPSWFLTGFQTLPFPNVFKLRIFDRYAAFGTRALLSLAVVITKKIKVDLEKGGASNIRALLQNPTKHAELQDWRMLLELWEKSFMSKKDYKSYFEQAGVTPFP